MTEQKATQPLKYTVTHYRKKEHTHDAFMKWMVEEHLRLAMPIFQKHGVIGYSLFTTPSSLNNAIKDELGKFRPSWDFAEYDCVIEYTMPSVQVIRDITADPGWHEAVKDQEDWVDTSRALVSIGYSTPYLLESGEVVNMPK